MGIKSSEADPAQNSKERICERYVLQMEENFCSPLLDCTI
jgi:hypothetical protein